MARTTPLFELNVSPEQLELSAFECLAMLEGEREIAGDLIAESELLITKVLCELDAMPADRLPAAVLITRERYRAHLTALRAFIGGGFHLERKES